MTPEPGTEKSFQGRYGPWSVVLGASEGLGEAYARELGRRGVNVVAAARRWAPLEAVTRGVAGAHGVEAKPVMLDLVAGDFLDTLRTVTDDLEVGLVVYNATDHFIGPFLDEGLDHARAQVAINVTGPLAVCDHFGRRMLERGRGGIVLMGSGAGVAGTAGLAVYSATKAFGLTLAQALHQEWRPRGVDVLGVIGPAMDTPNFRRHYDYDPENLPEPPVPPARVAREVLDAIGHEVEMTPGERFREGFAALSSLPRAEQSRLLSARFAATRDRPAE
ncbi:MAG: SDR family NAD(P)-dependent oxidoreductase [Acidimicrobiia bacterium]